MKELQSRPHRRRNILTNEWVLVSPHRTQRPWQGNQEEVFKEIENRYDPDCYLCPGNQRANGEINPEYQGVFVFDNDFAALHMDAKKAYIVDGLLEAQSDQGICRVICFSPDHAKSLAKMSVEDIQQVVTVWMQQYKELGSHDAIQYVQIFENKGAIMGCSNPHPHGQIWSQSSIPTEVLKKDEQQALYFAKHQDSLLLNYLHQELSVNERVIYENTHFAIVVPFWAVWPFETMIIPKTHQLHIAEMSDAQKQDFAQAISVLTKTYDKIFNCSFPYSSGIHQAPTDGGNHKHWHWHMLFYPPLLRSATVKKFMVGYELFANPQRDITPEVVASRLKELIFTFTQ